MFEPLAYLEWIEGRPSAATHDLGSSDLRRAPPGDAPDVVPSRLAGLPDPDHDTPLRSLVAAEYDVSESAVLVTAGATHANVLATATAHDLARERASDGERPRALVERPGYEPLVGTPRALGTRVDRFRRPLPDARLDPDRVRNADADGDGPLAHVTVTNRHNPTGRLAGREALEVVAAIARDRDAVLLVDEVYAPYVTGSGARSDGQHRDGPRGDGATAFGAPTAAGLPGAVVTGSLTKFHGLGGLRIGWVIGPERFAERARTVRDHVPALATPSVALARRFFANRDGLVAGAREHCAANHGLLREFLDERDDVTAALADGCPYGLLVHERADGDAVAEAAWDAGVLVVPGRFFGAPEGVRVSLGRDPEDARRALEAFGLVLDGL